MSSCYSFERVCPSDHGRPILLSSILSYYIHAACAFLCWPILVTWPPHFHIRLSATAAIAFVSGLCLFQHLSLCWSYNSALRSIFRSQVRSIFFSFYGNYHVWVAVDRYMGTDIPMTVLRSSPGPSSYRRLFLGLRSFEMSVKVHQSVLCYKKQPESVYRQKLLFFFTEPYTIWATEK